MKKFIIKINDVGRTLLKFLEKMLADVPKNKLERTLRNKDVKINGKRVSDKKTVLKLGDEVIVYGVRSEIILKKYQPIQHRFNVVYEDKQILVVNKETGVVVNDDPTSLDNQILNYLKFKQTDSFVPSSIGRLDKVTSGIVVYAKNYKTLRILKEQQKHFMKIYTFRSDLNKETTTNYKLGHDEDYQRQTVDPNGKLTKTVFFFEKNKKFAQIFTGRKHQIRASLSKLGFPIYGDRKYGGKKADRVYLHSYSIKFEKLNGDLKYLNQMEIICLPNW